ncbi:HlyD family type I secretion periplasmic adaptor subunit [Ruegeria sp. HKCCD4315]|uniref:HlyD family type I secretion periplasmic adaptor subunit n=2 Tax=Ruegeria TaxID=97050 RepID=UPI0014883539|nr:HlyD family type I secretion periplasmic adaptor subunit [Ruegeria sp. HKCCD4318-2]NOD76865.1 HlyD family type I secretion periplasmic adaptor subunit [Ruegeria sp. HKCCD4332]NOD88388.1 HlyD family type I secretion periplasmic adaptor subunit [Ruegeria sp. HKCCD4318]NOE13297.1 HlyD family type I secretion periplasmic adaptor subunit [Ruegeria sp. HKCCD4318-2]NOG11161.1 HlyD family type I secretion periplasmic adaptor subunit [Ruegeria sp. HKCCD4315]
MAKKSIKNPAQVWNMRVPAFVGFLALALLVGGLGYWAVETRLAGAIVSSGVIEVQSNRQVVEHPDGGVVGEIFVRDGDVVASGDMLLRLDDTFLSSEQTIVEAQLFELLVRRARLEAERDGLTTAELAALLSKVQHEYDIDADLISGQQNLFDARLETLSRQDEQLRKQVVQIESEIEGTQAQLVSLRRQVELIEDELEDQQSLLNRGLTQTSRVLALQREEASLNGEIGRLEAAVARLRGQIASTEIQIVELTATRREEAITTLRDVQAQVAELSERRLSLSERLTRLDIRAPVTGRVYGSQVFALQSVVQPGEPMMYVVPQDTPLLVAARVDAIHVDQLHVGQPVALRFPAFNQRETPELDGQVYNVSADTFTDEQSGFTFYRAEVELNDGQIDRLNGQELLPGMPVEALIKTDERTPLSYLVKPMADYFNRAFRE